MIRPIYKSVVQQNQHRICKPVVRVNCPGMISLPAIVLKITMSTQLASHLSFSFIAHPCSENNLYGWAAGQPCILIKLNKVDKRKTTLIHLIASFF